jgi:ATP-dependent RNA helicase DBP3
MDVDDKKSKKEKKEKKEKKRKLDEEEEAQVDARAEEQGADADDDAEKKARKKAKKEAKRLRKLEEAAAAEAAEAEASKDEEKAKKKKDKKDKNRGDEEAVEAPVKKSKSSSISSEIESNKKKFAAFEAKEIDEGSLYVPHDNTAAMSASEVASYRENVGVSVIPDEDAEQYKPITEFEYLFPSLGNHCPEVKAYLKKKNFKNPSAIQASCWPPLLAGRDVVGIAQTGSGKTLAFLIPALLKIARAGPQTRDMAHTPRGTPTPRILVIAPTRELAMQSHQVVEEIGSLKGVCIYGGVPKQSQKADLRAGAEVVVATPGRLIDLVDEGAMSLAGVRYLVLDEGTLRTCELYLETGLY